MYKYMYISISTIHTTLVFIYYIVGWRGLGNTNHSIDIDVEDTSIGNRTDCLISKCHINYFILVSNHNNLLFDIFLKLIFQILFIQFSVVCSSSVSPLVDSLHNELAMTT